MDMPKNTPLASGIVVWGTLAHQVWQEEYVILTKLLDRRLLCCEVLRSKNLLGPPFITGSSAEHTSHQMEASICMSKGMQCIVFIHSEFFTGNENSSGSSK